MIRLLLSILLIGLYAGQALADSPRFFRYSFKAGESFIIDLDVDHCILISGNETRSHATLQEKLTVLSANKTGFTVKITTLKFDGQIPDLKEALHGYDLLDSDETATVRMNRRGRFKEWIHEAFGSYAPPFLPLLPLRAVGPGEKREQQLTIKTGAETHSTTFEKWAFLNGRKVATFHRELHGRTFDHNLEYHTWDKYAFDPEKGHVIRGEIKHQSQNKNFQGTRVEFITYVTWTMKPERKKPSRPMDTW